MFVREGAVIPLRVTRPYTGLGDTNSTGFTTWLIYPDGRSQFTLSHPETHPKPEKTTVAVDSGQSLKVEISGQHEPHILRIFLPAKPARVLLDGSELSEANAWQFDAAHERLIIKTRDYAQAGMRFSRPRGLRRPRAKPSRRKRLADNAPGAWLLTEVVS